MSLELGKKRAVELGLKEQVESVFTVSSGYIDGAGGGSSLKYVYKSDDIHKILGEAGVKIGRVDGDFGWYDENGHHKSNGGSPTHQAILLGIRPIPKDTAESLLREMMQHHGEGATTWYREWHKRANALLEKK